MSYFESRLRININDFQDIKDKLQLCKVLGINIVILESITDENIVPQQLRNKIDEITDLKIYYRINIKQERKENLKKKIKALGNLSDIISVESLNKDTQISAAKDARVDIVSFSDPNALKTLAPGILSLIRQNNSFVEFSFTPVLNNNRSIQSKNFRLLYRSLELVRKERVNYIISGNIKSKFELRNPRGLASIFNTLLELPLGEAKKVFEEHPKFLLNRLNKRINKNIIEEGVQLLKREDFRNG
ncbi:MAG: hypothetical protein JW891_04475 [Candidatus Lokiarchaeota archaeon]|nr:hypothetical protein [Candidatus Lokiarchaeota archaeon]